MPDLGKYAVAVLGAWGVGLALILGLVLVTWIQSRAMKARLAEAEARLGRAREGGR